MRFDAARCAFDKLPVLIGKSPVKRVATPLGFEPRITPPKGAVLPLHHGVNRLADLRFSTAQRKLQLAGRRTYPRGRNFLSAKHPKDAKIHKREKASGSAERSPYQEKFMVTRAGKNCRAVILTANKKNGGENRHPTIGLLGRLRLPRCYSLGFGRRMSTVVPLP